MKEKDTRRAAAMDGNEAAAHAAYAFTEVAAIYPITPSSPMAEKTDEWAAAGRKNIFGQPVKLVEMQSEAGAVGAVHGAVEAGALSTSYTSSQGLMLMIPTMHRLSGTRQPAVLHVASRTVGTHAMSIFGDHSDVMNCRSTGWAMLSTGSVQEVMDLAGVAHLSAVKGRTPFMHFFDGFRTSHEIQKIKVFDYDTFKSLADFDAIDSYRDAALNPDHPTLRATVQNPDVYFQVKEAGNKYYDALPGIVEDYMGKINDLIGTDYHLFNYYGAHDAERVVIAMGSVSGTIRDTVEYLNARGEKVGYLQVHLFRPFSAEHFLKQLPATVKKIAVLDRCKDHGAMGEPLYRDICSVFFNEENRPVVVGGRYGLSSKDTDAAQIKAVFDNLAAEKPRNNFTIGIIDDVTGLSLENGEIGEVLPEGTASCKFWGLGSDGTVGANKSSVKIISEHTDMYAQAYFEYDTKKSYGITKSHLRFGHSPIRSTHYVKSADFVACHNQSYLYKYDMVSELKEGGTFLLNCQWSPEELETRLPAEVKRTLAQKKCKLYIIDGLKISRSLGLGSFFNMVLQSAFFKLADIIPIDDAVVYMKKEVEKVYADFGQEIVEKNLKAVDAGRDSAVEVPVPEEWKDLPDDPASDDSAYPEFIKSILLPIVAQKGDDLPVSAFDACDDGTMPLGTSAYEKRGIAQELPLWDPEKCIQCNRCAMVCAHACIRPYLLTEEEKNAAPEGFVTVPAKGKSAEGLYYSLQLSALDCTSCGACASECPAKGKALSMTPPADVFYSDEVWEYGLKIPYKPGVFDVATVKGSQFKQPLVEFSGACAGCGETPYAKLMTQLFGDRVYWANATGCSQAWGAAMPFVPYTYNQDGEGPAWSNSLFENNAEFSYGMALASNQLRANLKEKVERFVSDEVVGMLGEKGLSLKEAAGSWLSSFSDFEGSKKTGRELAALLEGFIGENGGDDNEALRLAKDILKRKDQLARKSIWMYGGDGWAYDIGYGGLDHVFASGEDVNVLVIDTEMYSNTGGQASKATPLGASVQFQSSGKKTSKKDLGAQFISYGNVYVAQVAMGADASQLIKALVEAESYPGPSIIIAYTPCLSHGIRGGMSRAQDEMKHAVDTGYWHLYRYDPRKEKPFTLDSPAPKLSYSDFLKNEVRYSSLTLKYPENASELFRRAEEEAAVKYEKYRKMQENQ